MDRLKKIHQQGTFGVMEIWVEYEETESYRITERFLHNREYLLQRLLE